MQAVVELALEGPFELGMVQIARMKLEIIGVYRNRRILELDDDFDAVSLCSRIEIEQGMLIKTKLGEDAIEASVGCLRHAFILME